MHTSKWTIDVFLFEDGQHTRAEAVLSTGLGTELRSVGAARRNPTDRDVPEIGDELAVCRALNGLVHDLMESTIADIEANSPGRRPTIDVDEPARRG